MDINNKINWLNIISNSEFQVYLDLKLVKELSNISKLFREKLKPLLFKSLVFSPSHIMKFNIKNNTFFEYFNYDKYGKSGYTISNKVKSFSIESGLKGLDMDLNSFKRFIRSLLIANVNRAGYYLFRLLNDFCNLTELNLYSCFIPYSGFLKLGESTPSLKQIELRWVMLVKLATDRVSIDKIALPLNLSYLNIIKCYTIEKVSIRDPYKFLFNNNSQFLRREFILPKITVPSLKELALFGDNMEDSGLKDFIKLNPNLESLKLKSFDFDIGDTCSSLKCLEINDLTNLNSISNTSQLCSITILKIATARMDYFDNISSLKTFCTKFPNLEEIDLKPCYYKSLQILVDEYLSQIIYKFPELKNLKLEVLHDWIRPSFTFIDDHTFEYNYNIEYNFDITNLRIEKLYLSTNSDVILNIKFEKCISLKQVMFYVKQGPLNSDEFIQKFKGYKDWKFNFNLRSIKGIKISK